MSTENNQHDDAVDQVLAALRNAASPEGMEARIAQRLQQHAAGMPARRLYLPAGPTLVGAWWRGALTGAAAATLVAGVVLFGAHLFRSRSTPAQTTGFAANHSSATPAVPASAPVPCANRTVLQAYGTVPPAGERHLRADTGAETVAPSPAAPRSGLTQQERELARLARTADPAVLATLNPEAQARQEAQEEADFDKFFAPPPAPPAQPDDVPSPNNE